MRLLEKKILEEGKILNIEKAKGFKKALSTLLGYMKEKGTDFDKYKIVVVHADSETEAENFVASIRDAFGDVDVQIQPVGPVIGAHCGPGTVGLIFHAKEK